MQVATFIHGNRLEILAERLIDDLMAQADADPLRGQVIVVGHPALGRWLQERIAERLGIAANIEFPLPSSFAWQILRDTLGDLPKESAFSREAMTWRIHAALPDFVDRAEFAPVRRYLGEGSDERKRFDLACQLARAYDEYMVARPDWIRAWSRGARVLDDGHEAWQAELWRHLVGGVVEADRASLMARAIARLAEPSRLPADLPRHAAVFGAAFLPPLLLEFFLALARRLPLRFYQPNPCLDYWGDIVSDRERARRLWRAHDRREDFAHADPGHPLLASWGRLGREYLKAIHEPDMVVHDDDAFVSPDSSSLLAWLQKGILLLDPDHADPPREAVPSIELHGCPDRRREVEVLHDRLLAMFEQRPELKPHDIVVMSPQVDAYVPYVEAVFGAATAALAMPFRISDVPPSAAHPLVEAFRRVLALGDSRFSTVDVLGLLAEPAIARRQGIDADGRAWIATWLDESAIRWGLDAAFRGEVGSAPFDENSWRFGFDRLLLGYALGDEERMVADVVPVANVEGADAQALGALARFVDELARTRAGFAIARTVEGWKDWLHARIDAVFDSEPEDTAELAAVRSLKEAILGFTAASGPWLGDGRLPFEVVRAALESALGEPSTSRAGRFGVTFCGMVPMRNVPHRVVCLLGLDAGAFPRRQPVPGFQLMRRHPRPGDRSVRDDDRFLFLEALVAARDVFYLSHVDRDAKGGAKNPPSPLVQELFDFLRTAHGEAWKDVEPGVRFGHHLQPFHPDYFGSESKWRSRDAAWWPAAEVSLRPWRDRPAFIEGARPLESDAVAEVVELDELLAWLRDPVKDWFRRNLPLRMQDEEVADDGEPFGIDGLERYAIRERLLEAASMPVDLHRLRREGRFPLGPVGDAEWDASIASATALAAATAELVGNDIRHVDAGRREIAIDGTRWRLAGTPRLLVEGDRRALLLRRGGAVRGVEFARVALERLLLGDDARDVPAFALGIENRKVTAVQLVRLGDEAGWAHSLVDAFVAGRRWPSPLFPKSASAYAQALAKPGRRSPAKAAREAWDGRPDLPGEARKPLNALLARDGGVPVATDAFARCAADVYGPLYAAIVEAKP